MAGAKIPDIVLDAVMDDNLIDTVTYKEWVCLFTDQLWKYSWNQLKSLLNVCVTGLKLSYHIHSLQSKIFQLELKGTLMSGEFLVLADYSENYSFVVQEEAQGFHWNNS